MTSYIFLIALLVVNVVNRILYTDAIQKSRYMGTNQNPSTRSDLNKANVKLPN